MSTSTRIIAIRHGETDWNLAHRYRGQQDIPLNTAGLQQAEALAVALSGVAVAAVYTSDLARASQTAEAVARRLGMGLRVDPALREQHFGVFEGLTGAEIAAQWPEANAQWMRRDPDFGPPGGETRPAFYRRCVDAVQRLAQAHLGETMVLVCHGGVMDCLYRAAKGLPLDASRTWSLDNAAISALNHNEAGFEIVEWGRVDHLGLDPADESRVTFPAP